MSLYPEPHSSNNYLKEHVKMLLTNYIYFKGHNLINTSSGYREAAKELFNSSLIILSHDAAQDPVFTYANKAALSLFEMSWDQLTAMESRKSAEMPNRVEREKLLKAVTKNGFTDNYSGIRISNSGKRFLIKDVTVWNLIEPDGKICGQAAAYSQWEYL